MNAFLKKWYWKIPIVVVGLAFIVFVAVVCDVFPILKQALNCLKRYPIEALAILNILLVCITVYFVIKTNLRAERLFVDQIRPLIDATPLGIVQMSDSHAMTEIRIMNYSGFTAYNIGIDIRYGSNDWIGEWIKADHDKNLNKTAAGVVVGHMYPSGRKRMIPKLKPGKSKEIKYGDPQYVSLLIGSLNLESACDKSREGLSVLVRTTWENHNGHIVDAVQKYRLICTKVASGRSFTFVPDGIISQKDHTPIAPP